MATYRSDIPLSKGKKSNRKKVPKNWFIRGIRLPGYSGLKYKANK